jgi:hypothetical protein
MRKLRAATILYICKTKEEFLLRTLNIFVRNKNKIYLNIIYHKYQMEFVFFQMVR